MTALLRLLGFSHKEICFYEEEIGLFASLVGADENRCRTAAEQLPGHYDLSFDSLRDLMKYLLETVFQDLKDLKVMNDTENTEDSVSIRQGAVPMPVAVAAVLNELNPAQRVSFSEYLIIYLAGILFGVYENLCSPGEHGCGRCGLNLSRERLYRNPDYPKPRQVVSCLGYCDEIYKTGETLSHLYGIGHVHFKGQTGLEYGAQKSFLTEGLRSFLMEETGADARDAEDCLGRCNDGMLEISLLLNRINHLAADGDVYVTFNETSLLNLFHLIWLPRHFEQGRKILGAFLRELKQKRKKGKAALKAPFRIGCLHLPFTNPFLDRCFRESGAAVIVSSYYEHPPASEKQNNEYERCLQGFYGTRAAGNIHTKTREIDRIIDEYALDAFLFGQFENDRALGGDQLLVMKGLKNRNKAHYMSMDNWAVMGERERTRIESLAAMMIERSK